MLFSARFTGTLRIVPIALVMLMVGLPATARAQDGTDYTISEDEGYGIADCMHSGRECGRVIADSWCESHGHAHVLAYGMGSDVTGSVTSAAKPITKVSADDVVIRCGD